MTLQPNFLPVGSVVEYNIGTTDKPEWSATVLDCQDLDWLVRSKDDFNLSHRPVPLTPEILTEWCAAKCEIDQYRIGNRLIIIRDGRFVDYGSSVQLDYLHELQLLLLGMKQVLPITIK